MDQMLPSPGFSIPSIGTPLHQPEEDQQILPNALQQQQQQQPSQQFQLQSIHSMNPGMQSGMLMISPQKTMHTYAPTTSFAPPQSLMQPQTPVLRFSATQILFQQNVSVIFPPESLDLPEFTED